MHSYNFIDLTGKTFAKLNVQRLSISNKNKTKWICICECGNTCEIDGTKLRSGHTKSCGCLKRSRAGLSKTRIYHIWRSMLNRCENFLNDNYYWYGLKGIIVCEEWHSFEKFYKWAMVSGYKENLSIDRIDSNGNYAPSNCRWVTQKEQTNNCCSNRLIDFKGRKYTISQFADLIGYRQTTVRNRLKLGWSLEKIITIKEREYGQR